MDKLKLFEYLNSGVDKSGNLKKENGFKKHYPELYKEYKEIKFPDDIDSLPFKQKLWHFLNDIYTIPKCKICGNQVSFITRSGKWGYSTYCSGSCAMNDDIVKNKIEDTKFQKYGDSKYNNTDKLKETLLNKDELFWKKRNEKSVYTRLEKNDGKYFSDDTLLKIRNTTNVRYGVDSYTKTNDFKNLIKLKHEEIQEKQHITKTKNNSFNTSSIEEKFCDFLKNIEIYNLRQYKSDLYPYSCDFYIPKIDLYIEIHGTWTHGGHPFDYTSKDDNDKLKMWREKNSKYYNNAIYTWTELDVKKREVANNNKLNYLEIFSDNIKECIDIFEEYLKKLLIKWCLSNEFPGTKKWVSNHPIWDCNIGNMMSPKYAWSDEKYLRKAINNMFKMIHHDIKFCKKHINELLKCNIKNNEIIYSSKKLLEMILNRFTIAKIAPKVTALDSLKLKNIIDDSGIDISNGVYIPMAGFGGIVNGVKMWGNEHNVNVDIEAYDINERFCNWYGWIKRDMLSKHIKTDKVCICCPPFGKKFEHWEGTPRDMSERTFEEWYHLIKEYIDAPNYIIIGPEKNNKNNCGLFAKKYGIMLWTDEMF